MSCACLHDVDCTLTRERDEAVEQLAAIVAALNELSRCPELPQVQYGVMAEMPQYREGGRTPPQVVTRPLAVPGHAVLGVMEAIQKHIRTLTPFGVKAVKAWHVLSTVQSLVNDPALKEQVRR